MHALLMISTVITVAVVAKVSGLADEDRGYSNSTVVVSTFDSGQNGTRGIVAVQER